MTCLTSSRDADAPRVYLAGPEVFLVDADGLSERKKTLCRRYGFQGVSPLDAEMRLDSNKNRRETGLQISRANEELIRSCNTIIANVTPFRGISADVGTVYEMGFARGVGLPVFAYTNVATNFLGRTAALLGNTLKQDEEGCFRDGNDMIVENWDLMDNLMIEGCIQSSNGVLVIEDASPDQMFTFLGGFEKCLLEARKLFLGRGHVLR